MLEDLRHFARLKSSQWQYGSFSSPNRVIARFGRDRPSKVTSLAPTAPKFDSQIQTNLFILVNGNRQIDQESLRAATQLGG